MYSRMISPILENLKSLRCHEDILLGPLSECYGLTFSKYSSTEEAHALGNWIIMAPTDPLIPTYECDICLLLIYTINYVVFVLYQEPLLLH